MAAVEVLPGLGPLSTALREHGRGKSHRTRHKAVHVRVLMQALESLGHSRGGRALNNAGAGVGLWVCNLEDGGVFAVVGQGDDGAVADSAWRVAMIAGEKICGVV